MKMKIYFKVRRASACTMCGGDINDNQYSCSFTQQNIITEEHTITYSIVLQLSIEKPRNVPMLFNVLTNKFNNHWL